LRSFRHWTARYLWDRASEKMYRARHPGLPWLDPTAIQILDMLLFAEDHGLELGSGRSTLWFSQRTAHLTSIEHNPDWYFKVKKMLDELDRENVDYQLHPKDDNLVGILPGYVQAVQSLQPASLNYVLIDGVYRDQCAQAVLDKLIPGGLLIIDNVHLYFPNDSRAPNSIPSGGKPATSLWAEVYAVICSWRCIWTGNGVSDTAIYFKPGK
jgi:predicted O-methyltransferase YrrM